jgi:hypothetical protein
VTDTSRTPSMRSRLLVSIGAGLVAGIFVLLFYFRAGPLAVSDWDATWVGAKALIRGWNPYAVITSPPWPWHLNYPLPAVILTVPFTVFPVHIARALFVGLGTALFTFVVTRRHYWPLYFVSSGAMLASWIPVAWSPFLVAAALTPALGWALVAKPTTGFVLWTARPTRLAVYGGAALILLGLLIQPHWIGDWLYGVWGNPHRPLILRPAGFLLLLGLLRWRRPEGRLLVALCLIPQTTSLYETFPLVLLVENRLQALAFACLTMVAYALHFAGPQGRWPIGAEYQWGVNLALVYLPALLLVLRRPNAAREVPVW